MRYRKGELEFYKKCEPKEIKEYVKKHKDNKKYVEYFLEKHKYDYVKKVWKRR